MVSRANIRLVLAAVMLILFPGCATRGGETGSHLAGHRVSPVASEQSFLGEATNTKLIKAIKLSAVTTLEEIIPMLANKRVVYIGETHDRFEDHLSQLEIIRQVHKFHPDLAIGMEYFQQAFQKYLDEYIAGNLTEKEFLKATEYYDRWKYDYRLYRPILRYARSHRIPLVALNIPQEIASKVSRSGLASLTSIESRYIPAEMGPADTRYRKRLKQVWEQHPNLDFEHFVEAQLLWDEGMAERAVSYLRDHPDTHLVVLAGSGHLAYGSGIPQRLNRRLKVDSAIVLNGTEAGLDPRVADYILLPERIDLPPTGLLGIYMTDMPQGVTVEAFADKSSAEAQGMRKGDRILSLDGISIHAAADVKIALLDKHPGDSVELGVRRNNGSDKGRQLLFRVNLH